MSQDTMQDESGHEAAPRQLPVFGTMVPVLALIGMFVSGYLAWVHWFGIEPICGELGECEVVNSSVYAEIYGVPVALLGFVGYASLLALGLINLRHAEHNHRLARWAIFGFSLAGVLYSGWLTNIELNVLRAICVWCVASAITIAAILVVSVVLLVRKT
ncbi:MAG: vitamin K epoxide reductase family protein [Chloroflexi bacterium]|nr:vitamin K epoxide reductase family protein [Chloroflexota bacterium]